MLRRLLADELEGQTAAARGETLASLLPKLLLSICIGTRVIIQ
jgi:hypothetical protein